MWMYVLEVESILGSIFNTGKGTTLCSYFSQDVLWQREISLVNINKSTEWH